MKVSNKEHKNFSPLQLTILNLPPTYRTLVSVGMFPLTVFTQHSGSAAEKFLLVKLLLGELEYLANGVTMVSNNKTYFVQVRLISTTMDTPALTSFFGLCAHTKAEWCPLCVAIKGQHSNPLNCRTWSGHRVFTSANNPLRLVGNSQTSCNCALQQGNTDQVETCRRMDPDKCGLCQDHADDDTLEILKNIVGGSSRNIGTNYLHGNELWQSISSRLQYEHCCLQAEAEDIRRSDSKWKEDTEKAVNNNTPVNGIQRWSIVLYLLQYARANKDFNYDSFHALMGVFRNVLNELKGGMKDRLHGIREVCKEANIHWPYFQEIQQVSLSENNERENKKRRKSQANESLSSSIPWVAAPKVTNVSDAGINTLMTPIGYNNSFQINNPFQQTGELRGHDVIMFFTVLIDYINLDLSNERNKGGIDKAYCDFLSMFGADIAALTADQFRNDDDIDELDALVKESIATYEGLFSPHLATYLMHEVVHLAKYIKVMGPLRHWSTYAGERSHTFWKPFIPKGGRSMDITVLNKANKSDITRTIDAYNFTLMDNIQSTRTMANNNRDSALQKRLHKTMHDPCSIDISETGGITFNPHKFYLYQTEKGRTKAERDIRYIDYMLISLHDSTTPIS